MLPSLALASDHPRIRGEHSIFPAPSLGYRRIIPAYAGSTVGRRWRRRWRPDHPRIRGEHSWSGIRGPVPGRIIPAYAGSTSWSSTSSRACTDHPRIRGEHDDPHDTRILDEGSSPHTRGARPGRAAHLAADRIIPAYAGSTNGLSTIPPRSSDHPRIRGEHGSWGRVSLAGLGSSPHTRGARR